MPTGEPVLSMPALPLDAYVGRPDPTVRRAVELTVRDCMRRHGFTYRPVVPPDAAAASGATEPIARLPYGLVDGTRAVRLGYADPDVDGQGRGGFLTAAPPSAFDRALNGSSATDPGCRAQAARTLAAGLDEAQLGQVQAMIENGRRDAARSTAVSAAVGRWRQCMGQAGHPFDSPDDAAFAAWPETPDRDEIATAVADVRCKQREGWLTAWWTGESVAQRREMDGRSGLLGGIGSALEARERLARAIVARG